MAVPSLTAWTAAAKVTASKLNAIHDAVNFLLDPPRCQIFQSAGQSFTDGAALAVVAFNSESYDTASMHDPVTNNSRITFTTAGTYLLSVYIDLPTATYTVFEIQLRLNGVSSLRTQNFVNPPGGIVRFPFERAFAAGDYVEMLFRQTSGANRTNSFGNNTTGMTARWVAL